MQLYGGADLANIQANDAHEDQLMAGNFVAGIDDGVVV